MPSPETTLVFAAALCAVLLFAVAALADAHCRLRDRVAAAERKSLRLENEILWMQKGSNGDQA